MKNRITLMLFAVFCIFSTAHTLKAQTKPIDELLERLEQVGDYHGSINDFFTQEEQLLLKAHFSEDNEATPQSAKNLEKASAITAWCAMNVTEEFGSFDPANGSTVTAIGGSAISNPAFENAGSINPADPNTAWVLANTGDAYTVDVTTGTYTLVGNIAGDWTGAEFDHTTGLFYAIDASGDLYEVDVPALTSTLVGSTGLGNLLPIALAIDGDGNAYFYEISNDELYSIDLGNGAASLIGSIGFDANFGQGMFWDASSDTVLMTAFNDAVGDSELRSVNTSTGATTLINQMDAAGQTQYAWASAPAVDAPPPPPSDCTVFEDFDAGLPAGWSTVVNSGNCDWANQAATPTGDDFPTPAMVFDDDACGNDVPASNVSLLSDVYDTSDATSILIGYDVAFQEVGEGETLAVEVWDGAAWQQIAIYDTDLNPNIQTEVDIDATAFANADFQVRWTYDDGGGDTWGWHAGIDNVCLTFVLPPPPSDCTVFEDFDNGLPAGWSTVVNSGNCDWANQAETPTGDDFPTPAMVFDDDACGNGSPASNVSLLSDVYDTSSATSILIGYDVAFQEVGEGETLTVEVWDGAAWQQVAFYDADLDPNIQTQSGINAVAFANADFQVRWTYDDGGGDTWGWHAGIDNVCLTLVLPPPPSDCTVFEDFDAGLPAGWSTVVNSGNCDWANQAATPIGDDFPTPAMVFDDDLCGNGALASNVSLLSDVYDTSAATSILIGYSVYFQEVGEQSLTVEVWDGAAWQQVAFYDADLDPNIQTESGINAVAFANADFQVRWTYDDGGEFGWGAGIDNFCLDTNSLGVNDNEIAKFDYYPNPATNTINLSADSNIDTVVIYNLLGQKVLDQNVNSVNTKLDISTLSSGNYIMRVSIDGQVGSYKVIKR